MQKYLLIAIGGACGSIARFWFGSMVAARLGTRFPYATFVVNLSACIILGFSLAFLERNSALDPAWRFLVPVGFVGAYSTFSTFEWETFASLQSGSFLIAVFYVGFSIILGLVGIWCGVLIARAVS